jgi:glycerophosphoryl diester phosphodiesterase
VRKIVLAAAAVLASAVVTVPAGAAHGLTPCDSLEIQAHRGYHWGRIDQNTVRSFDEASARGYAIETDVWQDAEGQLWIFHDRDVSKLTSGTGFIDKMTTAQVRELRYKKAGSPLPTFEEAVAAWTKYPTTRVYVEPKQRIAVAEMARQLEAAGLVDNVYFVNFWDYVEKWWPAFRTEPKSPTYKEPTNWTGHDALMTPYSAMTTERVDALHQAGLEVLHTRANTTVVWENAIRLNYDGILTDQPDQLKAFCPTVT